MDGPVDYTDLRTEFIGLIYEGLLDYRLKRTDEQIGPQVFLNLGREPVLPLARLEDMLANDKKGLKDLLTTLRKEKVTATRRGRRRGSRRRSRGAGREPKRKRPKKPWSKPKRVPADEVQRTGDYLDAVEAAKRWAREAVVLAGLVGKQGKRNPTASIRPASRPRRPGSSSGSWPPASSIWSGRATPARAPARSTPGRNWPCRPSTARWSRSATTRPKDGTLTSRRSRKSSSD